MLREKALEALEEGLQRLPKGASSVEIRNDFMLSPRLGSILRSVSSFVPR